MEEISGMGMIHTWLLYKGIIGIKVYNFQLQPITLRKKFSERGAEYKKKPSLSLNWQR